jgi:hypothetical protein
MLCLQFVVLLYFCFKMCAAQQLPSFNEEIGYTAYKHGTIQSRPPGCWQDCGSFPTHISSTTQLHQLLHAPQFALPLRLLLRGSVETPVLINNSPRASGNRPIFRPLPAYPVLSRTPHTQRSRSERHENGIRSRVVPVCSAAALPARDGLAGAQRRQPARDATGGKDQREAGRI